jgi:DNA-directed RNA polymerase specialized sigma24 family protein
METRDWLNRVKKIDLQIKNKLVEKQQWKDIALGITANMDGERVQSSGSQQKMADAITKCIDMEEEINQLVDKLIDTKREVIAVIEQVKSPTQYDLLHLVYIQGLKLQEVADRYGMSYDWAATTHGRALQNVEEIRAKK